MEKIQFGEIETIVEDFKEKIRILEETFVNPELTPQEDEEPEDVIERVEREFAGLKEKVTDITQVLETKEVIEGMFSSLKAINEKMKRKCNEAISIVVKEEKKRKSREEYLRKKKEWDEKNENNENIVRIFRK